jgi:spore germination protein YaaH
MRPISVAVSGAKGRGRRAFTFAWRHMCSGARQRTTAVLRLYLQFIRMTGMEQIICTSPQLERAAHAMRTRTHSFLPRGRRFV